MKHTEDQQEKDVLEVAHNEMKVTAQTLIITYVIIRIC